MPDIGSIAGGETGTYVFVSTSTAGVELECDPMFVLRPEQAMELAELLVRAARERVAHEHQIAGEIKDPERLAQLVEVPREKRRRIAR